MGWRKRLQSEPPERDTTPLYVATAGLLISIASYAVPNEVLAVTFFGSGLISAGFCIVYWLANPTQGND
jgi:hypothetical protein